MGTAIERAREGALEVLRHNSKGPFQGLPRTAAWNYPEPYTRDWMISALGILASGEEDLIRTLGRVLETLAVNQSLHGHIPSLAHDPEDRGASDTTPLFLLATALYRQVTNQPDFLKEPVEKSRTWMLYQSPADRTIVAQLPTSDWRDEQWVLGFGLFVNTVVYAYLNAFGDDVLAAQLKGLMERFTIRGEVPLRHIQEGLVLPEKPHYALWSYKIYQSERFDLLGNSLAILVGLAPSPRASAIIEWVETQCAELKDRDLLAFNIPPNLFPFIQPEDPDWRPRYETYNQPGNYHNGGIWPFICGFYIAALVAAGRQDLAEEKLEILTELVGRSRRPELRFGFNEWLKSQDGSPQGADWQTWSAAMYLYALRCVEEKKPLFFQRKP